MAGDGMEEKRIRKKEERKGWGRGKRSDGEGMGRVMGRGEYGKIREERKQNGKGGKGRGGKRGKGQEGRRRGKGTGGRM